MMLTNGSFTRFRVSAKCVWSFVLVVGVMGLAAKSVRGDETKPGQLEFDALRERYTKQLDQYWANVDDGKKVDVHAKYVLEHWPANLMSNEFLQLEAKHRGSLIGISTLHQIISAGGYPTPEAPSSVAVRRALRILTDHYADHADLDLLFDWLDTGAFPAETSALLQRGAESPHEYVRAAAMLTLAQVAKLKATIPARMDAVIDLLEGQTGDLVEWRNRYIQIRKRYGDVDVAAARREALELLDQVADQYGNVLAPPRTNYGPMLLQVKRADIDALTFKPRRKLAELAESMRFELTNLAIGQQAADIVGPDAFGKAMKLSDQRGKVVVLMFSFKGCGPCEEMYPSNRKLIEDYRGRPFSILGVMGDDEVSTVKESVEKRIITWPVWWDGGRPGPIARRWNVSAWPETYVMDHNGIIRYRELPNEVLAIAVSKLVKQAEQERTPPEAAAKK